MSIVSMALPVGALGYIVSSGLEAVQRWLDRMDAGLAQADVTGPGVLLTPFYLQIFPVQAGLGEAAETARAEELAQLLQVWPTQPRRHIVGRQATSLPALVDAGEPTLIRARIGGRRIRAGAQRLAGVRAAPLAPPAEPRRGRIGQGLSRHRRRGAERRRVGLAVRRRGGARRLRLRARAGPPAEQSRHKDRGPVQEVSEERYLDTDGGRPARVRVTRDVPVSRLMFQSAGVGGTINKSNTHFVRTSPLSLIPLVRTIFSRYPRRDMAGYRAGYRGILRDTGRDTGRYREIRDTGEIPGDNARDTGRYCGKNGEIRGDRGEYAEIEGDTGRYEFHVEVRS